MIKDVINKWLEKQKQGLIKTYNDLGIKASGNWANQLETFNEESDKGFTFGILGTHYTWYITEGRNRNKNQYKKKIHAWVGWAGSTFIKKWVQDKKIDLNPFAVAYKIARDGWKIPNPYNKGGLVTRVINNQSIKELQDSIILYTISDLKTDLILKLNKI